MSAKKKIYMKSGLIEDIRAIGSQVEEKVSKVDGPLKGLSVKPPKFDSSNLRGVGSIKVSKVKHRSGIRDSSERNRLVFGR